MDYKNKRLKLDCSIKQRQSLIDMCDWTYPNSRAIEYYDLNKTFIINYREMNEARHKIAELLSNIESCVFIGIHFDIPEYCVPILMLGIITKGHAFVNLSLDHKVNENFFSQLHINYIFVQHPLTDAKTVCSFELHGEYLYLIQTQVKKASHLLKKFAYAIATSGSTGEVKIVQVPHSCIVPNIVDLKAILSVTRFDKIAQLTAFTFDPCIIEIFLSFSCASTLLMTSKQQKHDANRLLRILYDNNVTLVQTTPSLLLHRWSTECLSKTIFGKDSNLRAILLGGEPIHKTDLLRIIRHPQNRTQFFNIYGITEVSCWASINKIELTNTEFDLYCLGKSMSETVFQVQDENGVCVLEGEGSLLIGSDTRVSIVDNEILENDTEIIFRDSGDIVTINHQAQIFYKSRRNSIIKRFGSKLNLQKLRNVVCELNFVVDCHTWWDEKKHTLHLCLSTKERKRDNSELRSNILSQLTKLPGFYKPDNIHFVDTFELTSNGKICTRFLQKVCTGDEMQLETSQTQRMTATESLENIWINHLGSKNDSFLKLGGTSITALQISRDISDKLKTEFPDIIGILLKDGTFEECLTYIINILLFRNEKETTVSKFSALSPHHSSNSDMNAIIKESIKADILNELQGNGKKSTCLWQRCKGTIHTLSLENKISELNTIQVSDIQVQSSENLLKCVDASPTVFQYRNGTFITVGSHSGIICTVKLNETSNNDVYKVKLSDRIEASILVLDNFQGIVGCYDNYIYCVHLKSGEIIWKYQTGDIVKCTAILNQSRDCVFIGSYDRHIYCLSTKDGSELWKVKASEGSVCASGSLYHQTNSVLFGTLDGSCLALQQLTGDILWKRNLFNPIFVSPTVLRDGCVIYCTVTGMLTCFDIRADVKMWTYDLKSNIFAYLVLRYDASTKCENLIVACMSKSVLCLELNCSSEQKEPALKCILELPVPIFATPWCENDLIFVACTDGSLHIYKMPQGDFLTSTKLPGDIFSSPVVTDKYVAVGCRDDNLYILKIL